MKLLNDKYFAIVLDEKTIKVGELMHLGLPYLQQKSEVIEIKRTFLTEQLRNESKSELIMTLLKDNSIVLQREDNIEKAKPRIASIIYPPPTGKDVLQFEYCMNLNKVFVLLATGSLCIYNYTQTDANQERFKSFLDASELQFVDKT